MPARSIRAEAYGRTARLVGYGVAVVLAVLATLALERSSATTCYVDAVTPTADGSIEELAPDECSGRNFREVAKAIDRYATALDEDEDVPFELTSKVTAVGELYVYYFLLGANLAIALAAIVPSVQRLRRLGVGIGELPAVLPWAGGGLLYLGLVVYVQSREFAAVGGLDHEWITPIVWTTILAGGAVALGLPAITATGRRLPEENSSATWDHLRRAGRTLRWQGGVLSTILTLAVLSTAARSSAIAALPGGDRLPSSVVIVYGAVFAIAMGAFFVPAHTAWLREVDDRIVDAVGGDRFAAGTSGRVDELRSQVGAQTTTAVQVRSSLTVLAPLVAAAASSLFG